MAETTQRGWDSIELPNKQAAADPLGDSGVETSPEQRNVDFTLNASAFASYLDGHSVFDTRNTSLLHRFAAFFGLVEDDEVTNMNKTITYNSVVGKIGFSHSFSGLLPSPRRFNFLRKRRRSRANSLETSANLLDEHDASNESTGGGQWLFGRRFTRNHAIPECELEEGRESDDTGRAHSSFWERIGMVTSPRLRNNEQETEVKSYADGQQKNSQGVQLDEEGFCEGDLVSSNVQTCSIWNGHLLDADEIVDHGFPTSLSRRKRPSSPERNSDIFESCSSSPWPNIIDAPIEVNVRNDVNQNDDYTLHKGILGDAIVFDTTIDFNGNHRPDLHYSQGKTCLFGVDGPVDIAARSRNIFSDTNIPCDVNRSGNDIQSSQEAGGICGVDDLENPSSQIRSTPKGRLKLKKLRSKSMPRLHFQDPKSEIISSPPNYPKFPGADDMLLNWSSSSSDLNITSPRRVRSSRRKRYSCPAGYPAYRSRWASLPITSKTTLRLLQSVSSILDSEMSVPSLTDSSSLPAIGPVNALTEFQRQAANDSNQINPAAIDESNQSRQFFHHPYQSDNPMIDIDQGGGSPYQENDTSGRQVQGLDNNFGYHPVSTDCLSRPVNIVNPMMAKIESDNLREALVLEDDFSFMKIERHVDGDRTDNIDQSATKSKQLPRLSNVSVIHESTVSSIANVTNSGQKSSSAPEYDAADREKCEHSTPMKREGRKGRLSLRFSPIQEKAEANNFKIEGSSDGSDLKRRKTAFDVFKKTSAVGSSSISFDPNGGRDRNDEGFGWCKVPFVTYSLFCLHVIVFAIYICSTSVEETGLKPKYIANNFTTSLVGTNVTRLIRHPNPWIGPKLPFLIGIGALYAPCIREDLKVTQIVKGYAVKSPEALGCCEVRDRGVAAMATRETCKKFGFGYGMIWTRHATCSDVRLQVKNSVVLRPCCVGVMAKCLMLAKVDCVRLDGVYHKTGPEHCSQVNCLGDVCKFAENSSSTYTPLNPNQWWRILVSPFYHYGALHLILTLVGYITIGRQLERSVGHTRIFMIYIGTSWMGLMTGGVFLPYHTHIGGTASVFGLFGVLQVQLIQTWNTHSKPCSELALMFVFFLMYIFFGLFQMIDNYEHIGGFWAGMLFGSCLLPYVTFTSWKLRIRRFVFAFSLSFLILTNLVIVFFYFIDPNFDFPEELVFFSCLPFTSDYCDLDDVEIW